MTRLQVVLDAKELAEIQRFARQQRMTTAEWVRQVLRAARRGPAGRAWPVDLGPDAALQASAVREPASPAFPLSEHEHVLRDIERGARPWLALRGTKATWTGDPLAPAVDPDDIRASS